MIVRRSTEGRLDIGCLDIGRLDVACLDIGHLDVECLDVEGLDIGWLDCHIDMGRLDING